MAHCLIASLVTVVFSWPSRDCLHQPGLFRSVLTSVWDGNWALVPILINCAFDREIRPFRRNQALDLLVAFFHNRRLRTVSGVAQLIEPRLADTERLLSDNAVRVSTLNLTHLLKSYMYLNLQMGRNVSEITIIM
jgi:hypothetical protein